MKLKILAIFFFNINLMANPKALVFGGQTGWIGQKIVKILIDNNFETINAQSRLENREQIINEINQVKPSCVINAAGVTGIPNVDWCEDNKLETLRSNIIGALNLADICALKELHLINLGTGCIYEYDEKHSIENSIGFTEEDAPNFQGSFYSYTKTMLDQIFKFYPNVLNLRLRMPISDDLHPRNFITKITKYKKVINIPNSVSILSDLLPLLPHMIKKRLTGTYNFVNPGVISHNEILDLYKKYVDPNFSYENFTVEEQSQVLKARRSNNCLDTNKLTKEFPNIPDVKNSMIKICKQIAKHKSVIN